MTRSWRRCSSSAAWTVRGRLGDRHPGSGWRGIILRDIGIGVRRRRRDGNRSRHRPAAGARNDARRDPVQRVPGADVRGGRAGECRRFPGGVPQMGGAGHRDRRGHRRRSTADHLARRDGRRRTAAHGRARGPGLPAARRAPRHLRMPWNADSSGAAGAAEHRCRAARDFACAAWQSAPVQPRVHHRAVRPLRARQHRARRARRRRACCASTRPPAAASRYPPTRQGVTPCSTPTPVPSSRWPRPTATSRSPAPPRSR